MADFRILVVSDTVFWQCSLTNRWWIKMCTLIDIMGLWAYSIYTYNMLYECYDTIIDYIYVYIYRLLWHNDYDSWWTTWNINIIISMYSIMTFNASHIYFKGKPLDLLGSEPSMTHPCVALRLVVLGGGPTPRKNMTTRQLGWWHSQYMENKTFQTTNQYMCVVLSVELPFSSYIHIYIYIPSMISASVGESHQL